MCKVNIKQLIFKPKKPKKLEIGVFPIYGSIK